MEFPNKSLNFFKRYLKISNLLGRLKNQQQNTPLSSLSPDLSREAIGVWKKILEFNPNNHGNWSNRDEISINSTYGIEKEVIVKMINLYNSNDKKIEGYITSGGSEANIFSAWIGKKYLIDNTDSDTTLCLLKTSLTHHSIDKAADILGIKTHTVALNRKSWALDIGSFINDVVSLTKKGFSKYLVPMTLGYTLTGTKDPYEDLCLATRRLGKKLDVSFFIWVDAAFNGLTEPFLSNSFSPFRYPEIQTIHTDFHKLGYCPLPAGVILYRKNLRKLIERKILYLDQNDSTLLGSRSGIPAVAIWAAIHSLGKKGFRQLILKKQKRMSNFIKNNKNIKNIEFIYSPGSLNCAVLTASKSKDVLQFSEKFGLDFKKTELLFVEGKFTLWISKAFFVNLI